jgi:hypothetical protein
MVGSRARFKITPGVIDQSAIDGMGGMGAICALAGWLGAFLLNFCFFSLSCFFWRDFFLSCLPFPLALSKI